MPAGATRSRLVALAVVAVAVAVVVALAFAATGGPTSRDEAAPQPTDLPATPALAATATPSASGEDGESSTLDGKPTEPATADPVPTDQAPSDPVAPPEEPAGTQSAAPTSTAPIDSEGDFGDGVTARVVRARVIDAEPQGPGEIAGPAVVFTIEMTNGLDRRVGLDGVTVNAYFGEERTPASSLVTDPASTPFTGRLAAGERARAAYVFSLPPTGRNRVRVEVTHSALSPMVAFVGRLADAT